MKALHIFLIIIGFSLVVKAGNESISGDEKSLVVGLKTNSVEGYGKFRILEMHGDTIIAVSRNQEILPGLYLVTSSSKNEVYHKKLWVVDIESDQARNLKHSEEILAIVTGIVNDTEFGKLKINFSEPGYFYAEDSSNEFLPGTYLVIGSSNQALYHHKIVIHPH